MLAYAFLAVMVACEHHHNPAPDGLIPLTCNEIHHLFNVLIAQPISNAWHRQRWSLWRRQHQYRAKISHYQRRTGNKP